MLKKYLMLKIAINHCNLYKKLNKKQYWAIAIFKKIILHFMQFFQQYKSSIFQKSSFPKSYWEVNINERSSLESVFWFSHLCNYKCCIPSYINLVVKFLNFLKDFTPTLYKLIFSFGFNNLSLCHHMQKDRKNTCQN